ncbi:thermonuclease family protein [Mesorhizobium sp. WSM3882]|uniref:thermonuclease family protein n=1 Tax=Mesorhizobium sp. WSM3882 TaxID=2029407 RepID=UPI001FD89CE7|nr:thermonuclease family protein [Mesorhizobium sp. WSM3882]
MMHSDRFPDLTPSSWIEPKPAPMTGVASVIDGDTIEIRGQRIRFNGIDAPESKQYCDDAKGFEYPCGQRSAEALDSFLAASRPVQCTFVTWDRYHRFVGDCRRADGASVAAWMVEHGQALDWPHYSNGAYAPQQANDKAARLGLCWQVRRALGLARIAWGRGCAVEPAVRHHQSQAGFAKRRPFVRAPAVLLASQLLRRRPMVPAQLCVGPQAG